MDRINILHAINENKNCNYSKYVVVTTYRENSILQRRKQTNNSPLS